MDPNAAGFLIGLATVGFVVLETSESELPPPSSLLRSLKESAWRLLRTRHSTSEPIAGIHWTWVRDRGEIRELTPLCPECKFELDISEGHRSNRFRDRSAGEFDLPVLETESTGLSSSRKSFPAKASCGRCNFRKKFMKDKRLGVEKPLIELPPPTRLRQDRT